MVFPVVLYGFELDHKESWMPKNCCFWTGWRRLLRVPWTARRSNQSIIKEISSEYSLEGLMLKLNLQYFGHLMGRTDWLETWCWERGRRRGDDRGWFSWMASLTQWTWVWASSGSWWWTGKPGMLQSMGLKELGITEWLNHIRTVFFFFFKTNKIGKPLHRITKKKWDSVNLTWKWNRGHCNWCLRNKKGYNRLLLTIIYLEIE